MEAIRSQIALIIKADAIIEQIENLPQQQFGVKILDTQMKALYKEIQKYEGTESKSVSGYGGQDYFQRRVSGN